MFKVKAAYRSPTVVHKVAMCEACSAEFDLWSDKDGDKNMRLHVLQTGHPVHVEVGSYNRYTREFE